MTGHGMVFRFIAILLSSLALVSCQTPAYQEQGWASHIADSYAGRMTSSGQPYYPSYYTAAHNTLPFGTEVTVTNLYNSRSVKAVVNDRFPYYPGRVINLSSAAAAYIGMQPIQLAQVKVVAYRIPQQSAHAGGHMLPQKQYTPQAAYPPQTMQPTYPAQQPTSYYTPQPQYGGVGYGTQPAAQAPVYPQQAPSYPAQPQMQPQPAPIQQQPASAPSFFQRLRGASTPSAPAYQGGGAPPPGLKTF